MTKLSASSVGTLGTGFVAQHLTAELQGEIDQRYVVQVWQGPTQTLIRFKRRGTERWSTAPYNTADVRRDGALATYKAALTAAIRSDLWQRQ